MKSPISLYLKQALVLCFILAGTVFPVSLLAQGTITISGIVKDQKSRKALEYVNVYIPNSHIGTITNTDGAFTLKVKDENKPVVVEFSHLGYKTRRIEVKGNTSDESVFLLNEGAIALNEVVVSPIDPRGIIEKAMYKVAQNYSKVPTMNQIFYRETSQKRRKYINIAEAVLDVYKTPYKEDITRDRVRLTKGRRLESPKAEDTLAVKLQGGPILASYLDIMKNPNVLLDPNYQVFYGYRFRDYVTIDGRLQYAIEFWPRATIDTPLYYGTAYIDKDDLAFTRVEFKLDISDAEKVKSFMLKKSPIGLRFKPEDLSYLVTYRKQGDTYFLNYIRAEIKFKCDWKRKLFSTRYNLVSELVVTDRTDHPLNAISFKDSFRDFQVLSDRVVDFYDETFWKDYNIIEPTESLEYAVKRLKKAYR